MKTFHAIFGIVCALALGATGCAQTGAAAKPAQPAGSAVDPATLAPELRMSRAFTTYGFDYLGSYKGMISPQDSLKLAIIAKQRAIAQTCAGFEVDEARYSAAMNSVLLPLIDAGSPAAAASGAPAPKVNLPFTIGMSGYSIFLGGNLALAGYDPDAMCAYGQTLRKQWAEEGGKDLLIWKDPA